MGGRCAGRYLRATDVAALLKDFGKATQQNDPIIHFYETFLAEFDPDLRKSRGVWYTPEPVVNFIVRAVDDILKEEFNLKDGLADTSKTTVKCKDGCERTAGRTAAIKRKSAKCTKCRFWTPQPARAPFWRK
ncbi:MAG: N-6 DNA methylase [Balneolaceae bacterium]|nr:N-6 DNA methylase [Balneolaceae bacterium]